MKCDPSMYWNKCHVSLGMNSQPRGWRYQWEDLPWVATFPTLPQPGDRFLCVHFIIILLHRTLTFDACSIVCMLYFIIRNNYKICDRFFSQMQRCMVMWGNKAGYKKLVQYESIFNWWHQNTIHTYNKCYHNFLNMYVHTHAYTYTHRKVSGRTSIKI